MILKVVEEAMVYYDPCGFINIGAFLDEYHMEAELISDYIVHFGVIHLKEYIIETFKQTLEERLDEDLAAAIVKRIKTSLNS